MIVANTIAINIKGMVEPLWINCKSIDSDKKNLYVRCTKSVTVVPFENILYYKIFANSEDTIDTYEIKKSLEC